MKVCNSVNELRLVVSEHPGPLAIVPTMGALHEGHLSLVDLAKSKAERVGVSIFVNPMQFNNASDLAMYPRDLDRDIRLLKERGVDYVFTPTVDQVYGVYNGTKVYPSKLASVMEGPNRPGHFEGVCTIVSILFNVFSPAYAVFGEKDFQQLRIIEDMVTDLSMNVEIVRAEISREESGLARSSRNERLTEEERDKAKIIFQSLDAARQLKEKGVSSSSEIISCSMEVLSRVPELLPEYLSIHREDTLEEVMMLEPSVPSRIFFAGQLGAVRLIDNLTL
jgi:pantoate--beta-alanine ligase